MYSVSLHVCGLDSRETRQRTVQGVEDKRQNSVLFSLLPPVADVRVKVFQPTDCDRHVTTLLTADQKVEIRRHRLGRRDARKVELDAGERKPQSDSTLLDGAAALDRQR